MGLQSLGGLLLPSGYALPGLACAVFCRGLALCNSCAFILANFPTQMLSLGFSSLFPTPTLCPAGKQILHPSRLAEIAVQAAIAAFLVAPCAV